MTDMSKERRQSWTPRDRERVAAYEREWLGPLRQGDGGRTDQALEETKLLTERSALRDSPNGPPSKHPDE